MGRPNRVHSTAGLHCALRDATPDECVRGYMFNFFATFRRLK